MTTPKKVVTLDTECFHGYYLIKFKGVESSITRDYEIYDGRDLDTNAVRKVLANNQIITFNGNNYDIPMIMLALTGAGTEALKAASDWIINGNHNSWDFYDHYQIERPDWIDHIDLIEVAFGQGSLKLYGGRLHSKRLQDLPLSPDTIVTEAMRGDIVRYCENDLDTTRDLYLHLKPQIELRERMSLSYGIDLRSKSDAQIAEAVIRSEVSKALGRRLEKPNIPPGTVFRYKAPAWVKFKTPQLQLKLAAIEGSEFVTDKNGSPKDPDALSGAEIQMGDSVYRMGIGGLHSSESCAAHWVDDETELMDSDVASYYPFLIVTCQFAPSHIREAFLRVYTSLVERRIAAKRAKDSVVADSLKLVLNSSFGKFGNFWSYIYAPDLMIQVTVTGQLGLLMLIETLESVGISVVSANTDGIVLKYKKSRKDEVLQIIREWEKVSGLSMEQTYYKALLSENINNYIAIKDGGGVKGKGCYSDVSISKNPENAICVDAVKAFLGKGVPVAQTIIGCNDIRKFLTVRTVKGGAIKITRTVYDDKLTPGKMKAFLLNEGLFQVKPGSLKDAKFDWIPDGCGYDVETAYRMHCGEDEFEYIGKVIRWYYAVGVTGCFHYGTKNTKGNRNKVPSSDGAKALMELPETLPADIDYEFYIREANAMLSRLGFRF
jgi:hypothetical protein